MAKTVRKFGARIARSAQGFGCGLQLTELIHYLSDNAAKFGAGSREGLYCDLCPLRQHARMQSCFRQLN
jgi:hypothetical protein